MAAPAPRQAERRGQSGGSIALCPEPAAAAAAPAPRGRRRALCGQPSAPPLGGAFAPQGTRGAARAGLGLRLRRGRRGSLTPPARSPAPLPARRSAPTADAAAAPPLALSGKGGDSPPRRAAPRPGGASTGPRPPRPRGPHLPQAAARLRARAGVPAGTGQGRELRRRHAEPGAAAGHLARLEPVGDRGCRFPAVLALQEVLASCCVNGCLTLECFKCNDVDANTEKVKDNDVLNCIRNSELILRDT